MPWLTIAGSGIQSGSDMTRAARESIKAADKVLYLATERITSIWLKHLNSSAESLHVFYGVNKSRATTYRQMVEHIMSFLRRGLNVCVVAYGHPGVFATPMHEAVRLARKQHYAARMFPGISCIDWLYADLNVDPADSGCQIYEASHFLGTRPGHNIRGALILLQVGIIGEKKLPTGPNMSGFRKLTKYLSDCYGPEHEMVIYEAAQYAFADPVIQRLPLKSAAEAKLSSGSTLYVPPLNHDPKKPPNRITRKKPSQRRAGTHGRASLRQTRGFRARKSLRSLKSE
jgi:uncharacterized protein YabN with tetrapyrrole methylase and pyrophosphatase domain